MVHASGDGDSEKKARIGSLFPFWTVTDVVF